MIKRTAKAKEDKGDTRRRDYIQKEMLEKAMTVGTMTFVIVKLIAMNALNTKLDKNLVSDTAFEFIGFMVVFMSLRYFVASIEWNYFSMIEEDCLNFDINREKKRCILSGMLFNYLLSAMLLEINLGLLNHATLVLLSMTVFLSIGLLESIAKVRSRS